MNGDIMKFHLLTIEHKEIFDKYLSADNLALSDINFTNCYMWRHAREISFAEVAGNLIIKTQYQSQEPFVFYPIGGGDKEASLECLREYFGSLNLVCSIRSLSKEQAKQLQQIYPLAHIQQNRDRFDYIYNVSELMALSGRKYHKKKNHLNSFLQEYPQFVFESISASNIAQIQETYTTWYEANPNKNEGLSYELLGINDALNAYERLALRGGVIKIDGQIAAFSFGEDIPCVLENEGISGRVAVIHIEKAHSQYRGIFQAINQQTLTHCFKECAWVNREEDLGIEGLRKAKLSYQPAFLLEKFEATIS